MVKMQPTIATRHFSMEKVDLVGILDTEEMVDMVEMVDNMNMVENVNSVDSIDMMNIKYADNFW